MANTSLRALGIVIGAFALIAAACGASGSASTAPIETATPAPSPVASEPAAAAPAATPNAATLQASGARILADVRHLSETIGPRPAGTAREKEAADFIADRLRGLGYAVRLQEFALGRESGRTSSLGVVAPQPRTLASVPMERSGTGSIQATLVSAGGGRSGDFNGAGGNVVLIERGGLTFNEMVANAQAAGARGVLVFNNEAGIFYGSLSNAAAIPVVALSQSEGRQLAGELQNGAVRVELSVGLLGDAVSYNVVATPPDRGCETVSGGHYDSVPQAAGASDNATGTATLLEVAMLLSKAGNMDGHCFVLFGAEEPGLIGSRAYVNSLDNASRQALKAMLNFDMVGVGDETWLLIGTPDLQQRAGSIAAKLNISTARGTLLGTSSDHASFVAVGIPSLMLHRSNDPLLHTPEDVVRRVRPELLEDAARFGVALLESLNAGG